MDAGADEASLAAPACAAAARRGKPARGVSHNLQGQRLGRKGRDTRDRILIAAHELFAEPAVPGTTITLSEVARRAHLRVGSLYLYFADLTELLLALMRPVMAAAEDEFVRLLRRRWADDELADRALEFVGAYYGFWVKHSRLLHLRNTMADGFDERMMQHRVRSVRPLLNLLIEQMDGDVAQPGTPMCAMATALMTGLERVATVTTDPNLPALLQAPFQNSHQHLLAAEARLIELGIRDYRMVAAGARAG